MTPALRQPFQCFINCQECHHQNDSCIKMGSDESHFNVWLMPRTKSQDSVHKPQPSWREGRAKATESSWGPSAYQPNALPPGQTSSLRATLWYTFFAQCILYILILKKHVNLSTNHNLYEEKGEPKPRNRVQAVLLTSLKPVLNWANVCSPEHTSDTSTNYDSFLNWTFSSPNMVRAVQTLLHSQLACNEMQASARTCGRRAADSMIENVG